MEPIPALSPKDQRKIFFRLMGYATPHRKTIYWAFFLLLLTTIGDVFGPILIKVFIDDYLTPGVFPYGPLVALGTGYLLIQMGNVSGLLLSIAEVPRNRPEDHPAAEGRCVHQSPRARDEIFRPYSCRKHCLEGHQ